MMNKRLLITGKVQGVGFRKSCLQEATRLKLKGWVRNLTDGRVEIQVSGQDTDVAALMDWAKIGPRFAKVKSVDVFESNEEIQEVFWIRGDGN